MAAFVVAAMIRPSGTVAPPPPDPRPAATRSAQPPSYALRGFVSLAGPVGVLVSRTDTVDGTSDPACWGQRQYADIMNGTVVTVYDDHGNVVANGGLGPGRAGNLQIAGQPAASCLFPILVDEVPAQVKSYRVEIAGRAGFVVDNAPEDGVLYAYVVLDEDPASTAPDAALPPQLPQVATVE